MHPDPGEWLAWIRAEAPGAPAGGAAPHETSPARVRAQLAEHLERCGECRRQVAFLQQLEDGSGKGPWEAPPAHAIGTARGAYLAPPSQRGQVTAITMSWSAPDVRSTPGAVAEQTGLSPRVAAGALEQAQISLMATPPDGEGLWRVHGTVWLRQPDPRAIRVSLFADDHELASVETHDGEAFTIDELLPPGWSLEIELPTGQCIQLQ
jgi:hypothetical protein